MKVIVNTAGFFGGTWYEAKSKPQDMPDAIAKAFLPPHGDQLTLPGAKKADDKPVEPVADKKAG